MADIAHLIEPVIPALRRYARTFVRDAAAADDLVQDTLERAISRWHQRRSDGDARTWMFTILHNLAVSHLRRAARRGRELPLDEAGESDVAVPSTQEDALRHDEILAAVGRLPDDQRSVRKSIRPIRRLLEDVGRQARNVHAFGGLLRGHLDLRFT